MKVETNWLYKLLNWKLKFKNKTKFYPSYWEKRRQIQMFRSTLIINHPWLSMDCHLRVQISKAWVTSGTDFIPLWEIQRWNPFIATSLSLQAMRVILIILRIVCFLAIINIFLWFFYDLLYLEKVSKNGSDTTASNQHPSISTLRDLIVSTQKDSQLTTLTYRWT